MTNPATTLAERLTAAGHKLAAREIIVDDVDAIRIIIKRWIADPGVDVIITTGGTGFTGRDVTPEAIEPLFEKRMDGFSIAFHMLSHAKIGTSTIQSRATAGVAGATFIFCLPGSPGACRDGWDGILAAQLDYRTRPCNFVEIMPRLDEHLRRPKAKGAPGMTANKSKLQLPGLADQALAETAVRLGGHQHESGVLIDPARGDQDALGPQRDLAIAACAREGDAFGDQPPCPVPVRARPDRPAAIAIWRRRRCA